MSQMMFVPDRFDIIYMIMEPQAGTEITKRRPCLVLSTKKFNSVTSKAFICPITSSAPMSLAQIPIQTTKITGTILVDQFKSLDWKSRNAQKIDDLKDKALYKNIVEIIDAIINIH